MIISNYQPKNLKNVIYFGYTEKEINNLFHLADGKSNDGLMGAAYMAIDMREKRNETSSK